MSDKLNDVNTTSESSTEATAARESAEHDAMDSSSESQTGTQQGAQAEQTMADVIKDVVDQNRQAASESPTEGATEQQSGSKTEQDAEGATTKDGEGKAGTETEERAGEEGTEDKGPVPYDRFQEVVHARQGLEQQLTESKPKVESYDKIAAFCQNAEITPEQFNQALEIQAMINTSPEQALPHLRKLVEQLEGVAGDRIPADLQAAVDNGDITLAYAKRLVKAEAQRQLGEQGFKSQQARQQAEQAQRFRTDVATAANAWEQTKRKADPDYMPKGKSEDADGKWEMCRHVFTSMLHQTDAQGNLVNPIRTAQDMTALMERAYTQVNATFTKRVQRPAIRRPLSSTASSNNGKKTIEEASSMAEAVKIALANRE